ncbi:unnamed protein product [Ilex paraguariensis]|uniref:Uncharacterized protein n=1 Tax=Ilex paraguariensis TaxID=185542 RepID=A0ABC8R2E3_9AQUA
MGLESAKAEKREVKEENERLKMILSRIMKDYQSLKMHFHDNAQLQDPKKPADTVPVDQEDEEQELVSLSLGRFSSEPRKDEKKIHETSKIKEDGKHGHGGLELGLDCRFDPSPSELPKNLSTKSKSSESKEEEPTETWPPSKSLKTVRGEDDDVTFQSPLKKARVSVRALCDTPTVSIWFLSKMIYTLVLTVFCCGKITVSKVTF